MSLPATAGIVKTQASRPKQINTNTDVTMEIPNPHYANEAIHNTQTGNNTENNASTNKFFNPLNEITDIKQASQIITDIISKFNENSISNIMPDINMKCDKNFVHQINDMNTTIELTKKILSNFTNQEKAQIISQLIETIDEDREKSRTIVLSLHQMEPSKAAVLITNLNKELEKQNHDKQTSNEYRPETEKCKTQTPDNDPAKKTKNKRKSTTLTTIQDTPTDIEMTTGTEKSIIQTNEDNEFGFPAKKNKKRKNPQATEQDAPLPSTSSQTNEKEQPKKPKQVPPRTLTNPQTYQAIKKAQTTENINITSAREKNNQIKIFPTTPDDHRKITKLLDQHNQEYFCVNIDSEKVMKIVIKGLPTFLSVEDIEEELRLRTHYKQNRQNVQKTPQ